MAKSKTKSKTKSKSEILTIIEVAEYLLLARLDREGAILDPPAVQHLVEVYAYTLTTRSPLANALSKHGFKMPFVWAGNRLGPVCHAS